MLLYVVVALVAMPFVLRVLGEVARALRRWRIGAPLLALATVLAGCGMGDAAGAGGDSATTTTTATCTDECGCACVAPSVCGIGCGTSPGCFTPGGSLNPGPNDCASCFPMFGDNSKACGASTSHYPYAYYCQTGAQISGCVVSTYSQYTCCPPGVDGGVP